MDSIDLPDYCTDAQLQAIVGSISVNTVLTQNQKAFYIEMLQKKYAQILIQRAVKSCCKPQAQHTLEEEGEIYLHGSLKRPRDEKDQ